MFKTIIETIFFYSVFFGLIYTLKYAHAINQLIIELKGVFNEKIKNKFIKKKIKGMTIDVRTKDSLYITIGNWVVYIDNSTNEKIINTWNK